MISRPALALVIVLLATTAAGLSVYVFLKIRADLDARPGKAPPKVSVQGKPAEPSKRAGGDGVPVPRPEPRAGTPAPKSAPPPAWKQALEAGLAAYRDKRPEDAERLYADALAEAKKSGRRTARALVLTNTGSLYWSMRKLDEAEVFLLRATAVTDELGQAEIVADLGSREEFLVQRTERMLGVVYRDQGNDAQAERRFANAVAATRKLIGVRPETVGAILASDLIELALAQCRLGKLPAARGSLEAALKSNPQSSSVAHQFKAIERVKAEIDSGKPCRR